MVERFILQYAKLIAAHPEEIRVAKEAPVEGVSEVVIHAHSSDVGKLIGRDGRMISAIKTVVSGCKAKDGIAYRIVVRTSDDGG